AVPGRWRPEPASAHSQEFPLRPRPGKLFVADQGIPRARDSPRYIAAASHRYVRVELANYYSLMPWYRPYQPRPAPALHETPLARHVGAPPPGHAGAWLLRLPRCIVLSGLLHWGHKYRREARSGGQ